MRAERGRDADAHGRPFGESSMAAMMVQKQAFAHVKDMDNARRPI